jgi:hypothetical protein
VEDFPGHALQVTRELRPGPGRDEFVMVCSRCHALPDPRMHSPADWLAVYLRMERNMERMNVRPATQEEGVLILSYLQSGVASR